MSSRFYEQMRAHPGDAFAKAGIEGALWDAYAKTWRCHSASFLGARARPIPSGVAIGIYDHVEDLLERVARYTARVIDASKSRFSRVGTLSRWRLCERDFPDLPLMVDANAAYSLADAAVFRELDGQA